MRQLKVTKRITVRDGRALDKYMSDVNRQPLINGKEEAELAKKVKEGDITARDKLITANLRFVISVAKQYQHTGLALPDLINEGNIGLLKAAVKFDESRGFRFISYAVWWIRQSIMQAIAEKSRLIKIPTNKINEMHRVRVAYCKLEQQIGRPPTDEELSNYTGLSQQQLQDLISLDYDYCSIDSPHTFFGEQYTLGNTIKSDCALEPQAEMYAESFNKDLKTAFSLLDDIEQYVIFCSFNLKGKPAKTFSEIAVDLGLSRERVRQVKYKALKKLRNHNIANRLKSYL